MESGQISYGVNTRYKTIILKGAFMKYAQYSLHLKKVRSGEKL